MANHRINRSKSKPARLPAKERHRRKLIDHLSEPDLEFPRRSAFYEILGLSLPSSTYAIFSPADLDQIEAEALANRRARYSRHMAAVDAGVLRRAKGDGRTASADAQLAYRRLEDWEPGERVNIQGGQVIEIVTRFEFSLQPGQLPDGQAQPRPITEVLTVPRLALMEPAPAEPTAQE